MKSKLQFPLCAILLLCLLLACNGEKTATVEAEPVIIFGADPAKLHAGACSTLRWEVIGGLAVLLDNLPVEKAGQQEVCPEETTRYVLAVDLGTSMFTRQVEIFVIGSEAERATVTPAETPASTAHPSGTWVRTGGPPGGLGYDIRYNFDDHRIWYVTDAYAGIHISTDRGLTWSPANEGIPPQSGPTGDAIPIFSLTVDPHDPQILWAGTQGTGHIYRSSDGGATWQQRDNGITIEYDGLTFRGFTIDPRSSDIVYAMAESNSEALGGPAVWGSGTGGVVYVTRDGGLNWSVLWDGGVPSSLTRYMWIDPADPQVLFVSTGIFDRGASGEGDPATDPFGGLGVLFSQDGGLTWTVQDETSGLRMLYLGSMYMHPEDADLLLVAAGHALTGIGEYVDLLRQEGKSSPSGIYRTEDRGAHWTQVLFPPNERMLESFSSVEFCPGDADIAYAASDRRVYRSEDAGITWQELPYQVTSWGPPGVRTGFPIDIQCDPDSPDRLFINNYGGGNFLSEDGGKTWVTASDGYTGAIVRQVAVDPRDAATVYAAGPSGIWLSSDGGSHWEGIAYSTEDVHMDLDWNTVVVDPVDSQHLLLAGSPQVIESLDGGRSWRLTSLTGSGGKNLGEDDLAGLLSISVLVFAPSDPEVVYGGFAGGSCLVFHEACPGSGGGVIISHDGGASWTLLKDVIPGSPPIISLAVDPTRSALVYAGTETGLYLSSDSGSSWQAVTALPTGARVRAVAIDPGDGNHILAAGDGMGVWESTDGGGAWQAHVAGLESNGSIHALIFDPTNPSSVYASDHSSGVYVSEDGGGTWLRITTGLDNRAVTGMAISTDGQHLYVGTQGGGVFRLDLNDRSP